jgi:hypothetical protein
MHLLLIVFTKIFEMRSIVQGRTHKAVMLFCKLTDGFESERSR